MPKRALYASRIKNCTKLTFWRFQAAWAEWRLAGSAARSGQGPSTPTRGTIHAATAGLVTSSFFSLLFEKHHAFRGGLIINDLSSGKALFHPFKWLFILNATSVASLVFKESQLKVVVLKIVRYGLGLPIKRCLYTKLRVIYLGRDPWRDFWANALPSRPVSACRVLNFWETRQPSAMKNQTEKWLHYYSCDSNCRSVANCSNGLKVLSGNVSIRRHGEIYGRQHGSN